MEDIHGNIISEGDNVYIVDAARAGSKHKRLLYGMVDEVNGSTCRVFVYESKRYYNKTSATILKPLE